ncbi:MAG: pyruvate kinase [Candidatus ainarchaeum sp.]|nr:pyruvate kinase [Candidatus ainarchaeum sp.]
MKSKNVEKVNIIATIGPSSVDLNTIKEMKKNGMDIGRINTKYGDTKQWQTIINNLRKVKAQVLIDVKFLELMPWIREQDFDYLAISFADSKDYVIKVKNLLNRKDIQIISKIESEKGFKNLSKIIEVSDIIMVARGDLGKSVSFEKIAVDQKRIIKTCLKNKTRVITATEMMLSMVEKDIPTRAESSDVTNAVLDGSNYVMLSEETAIGKHPVIVISAMSKIIKESIKYKLELEKNGLMKKRC